MTEMISEQPRSLISLMRGVSSDFDDTVVISAQGTASFGSMEIPMPLVLEKTKLLRGIQLISTFGAVSSSDILEQQNMQLRNENIILKEILNKIEERLSTLEASQPREKVIVLRELSVDDAKKEIKKLFATGRTLYYSDIARELGLDLRMVVDICDALQTQGEITVDDRACQQG